MLLGRFDSNAFLKRLVRANNYFKKHYPPLNKYMSFLSVTFIPDINLFTPDQCDIELNPYIKLR